MLLQPNQRIIKVNQPQVLNKSNLFNEENLPKFNNN